MTISTATGPLSSDDQGEPFDEEWFAEHVRPAPRRQRVNNGWWSRAACAGVVDMPESASDQCVFIMIYCNVCPVKEECKADYLATFPDYHLRNYPGVRGGLTQEKARKMHRAVYEPHPFYNSCSWCGNGFLTDIAQLYACTAECHRKNRAQNKGRYTKRIADLKKTS